MGGPPPGHGRVQSPAPTRPLVGKRSSGHMAAGDDRDAHLPTAPRGPSPRYGRPSEERDGGGEGAGARLPSRRRAARPGRRDGPGRGAGSGQGRTGCRARRPAAGPALR